MTLAIALIMTFLTGGLTGVFVAFYALNSQNEIPLEVRMDIHPSTRRLNNGTILDYSKTQ